MEEGSPMKNRPLIIAHRGWSSRFTENTLPAIRAALDLGVDFVEIDVHETRDGEIVVFHDYRLNRLCGVRGWVRNKTLAELKALRVIKKTSLSPKAGLWERHSCRDRSGQECPSHKGLQPQDEVLSGAQYTGIPTLAEVLRACRGKARVLIEIKRADPRKVAAVIERCWMTRKVIVFSVSVACMKQFAAANPQVARFGLVARRLRSSLLALRSSVAVQGLGLSRRLVRSRAVVERIHRRGWKLFVWTVNRRAEMERLSGWGVDGLITNHPDRALELRTRDTG
jgi:glycerophosphoryl diester phosphodiesterase